jgi:drug/metabolite transporter (DMT)-like permease
VLVVALSLTAALFFAVAAVLQQHVAFAQPIEHNLRPSLVVRLAQQPLWLAGVAASALGSLMQLVALWHGSLVTVQPLLVCGLLFALIINAVVLHRRWLGRLELLAASVVCLGLAIFLIATDPGKGSGQATTAEWVAMLSALGVVVALLVSGSLMSRSAAVRAGLLASAAGVINGVSAAFSKGIARDLGGHWQRGTVAAVLHTFTNWELYAFAATLLLGVLLLQSAFQTGPIRWSLPALTAFNPVTSVVIGVAILGEHIRSGPLAVAGAVGGLLLVVAGVLALSSSSLITGGAIAPSTPADTGTEPAAEPEIATPALPASARLTPG